MLDAEAIQMLARAEELSSAGLPDDAAGLCESAGDRLLSLGDEACTRAALERDREVPGVELHPMAEDAELLSGEQG